MGECLIARGQTATKNVLDDISVSGDYCSIVVLLQDSAGGPCENTKINCKDGTRWYNYTTNEAGMVLFKCNSGAANISANNWINGIYTFDQAAVNKNYDAPVGTKRLETLNFGKVTHFNRITSGWYNNGQFRGIDYIKNLVLVGGGGGGANANTNGDNRGLDYWGGGGGGGGALNYSSNISIVKNQKYNFYIGKGGVGGQMNGAQSTSGETTSAFGLSANGGGGGNRHAGGIGGYGLYKGGNGANSGIGSKANNAYPPEDGENGAGGGGGAGGCAMSNGYIEGCKLGANNGGGNGFISNKGGKNGSGGGGGGGTSTQSWYGGNGGSGRIEFDM